MMVARTGTTAQRIRIGLTGLAFAFLLVLLGSVITRSGQGSNEVAAVENVDADVVEEPTEPLAELGVAPGPNTAETVSNSESE